MAGAPFLANIHDSGYIHVTVNNAKIVKLTPQQTRVGGVAEALGEILASEKSLSGGRIEASPANAGANGRIDFEATVSRPDGTVLTLQVYFRNDPRASQIPAIEPAAGQDGEGQRLVQVLAAPGISSRLAEVCDSRGWSWFDLRGNYRIEAPGLVLRCKPNTSKHARTPPAANLRTPAAARVVRALLANAGHRWTQLEVSQHFGRLELPVAAPSVGLVNKVVRRLMDDAFVEPAPNRGFRVSDWLGLLRAWRDVYSIDRHRREGWFTLLRGDALAEALAKFAARAPGRAALAAFSAADVQAPHVRQPKTWLYVGAEHVDALKVALDAKPAESGENLVILIPEDDGVFYMLDRAVDRMAATNPVQTHVDLYHCGGRGEEAADAILYQVLAPAWRAAGLA